MDNKTNLKVIKLTNKHISQIALLETKYFGANAWPESQWDYELNTNPCSVVKGILIDDKLIGYIDFWITFDSSTIAKICVDEQYRNKGIATMLFKDMFDELKANEVLYTTLEVRVSNIPAISLYKKHGYEIITTKPRYYSDGEDAYYMVKGV